MSGLAAHGGLDTFALSVVTISDDESYYRRLLYRFGEI